MFSILSEILPLFIPIDKVHPEKISLFYSSFVSKIFQCRIHFNFPLKFTFSAMQLGAKPEKTVLGVPLYGRSFLLQNKANNGGKMVMMMTKVGNLLFLDDVCVCKDMKIVEHAKFKDRVS